MSTIPSVGFIARFAMPVLKDMEVIDVDQGMGVMKTTPKGFRVGSLLVGYCETAAFDAALRAPPH